MRPDHGVQPLEHLRTQFNGFENLGGVDEAQNPVSERSAISNLKPHADRAVVMSLDLVFSEIHAGP